eukprot:12074046-Ditylum_brightwellii.AAC.1
MVRVEAGYLLTCNKGYEFTYLPPCFTMRGDYVSWVMERGWKPIKKCKGKQKFALMLEWEVMDE